MESTINSQEIYKLSFKEKLRNFYHDQKGWIYILPILALMAVFTFYPLIRTTIYAFQNNYSSLDKSYNGWGFENFAYVLQYKKFQYCLANTVLFSVFAVPISTLLALLISVGLNSIK